MLVILRPALTKQKIEFSLAKLQRRVMTNNFFLLRHSGSKEGQIVFKIIFTEYPLQDFLLRHSGSKDGQI